MFERCKFNDFNVCAFCGWSELLKDFFCGIGVYSKVEGRVINKIDDLKKCPNTRIHKEKPSDEDACVHLKENERVGFYCDLEKDLSCANCMLHEQSPYYISMLDCKNYKKEGGNG